MAVPSKIPRLAARRDTVAAAASKPADVPVEPAQPTARCHSKTPVFSGRRTGDAPAAKSSTEVVERTQKHKLVRYTFMPANHKLYYIEI